MYSGRFVLLQCPINSPLKTLPFILSPPFFFFLFVLLPVCDSSSPSPWEDLAEGMDVTQLQRRWLDFLSALFNEGYLDGQFNQLLQLQDENNRNFVSQVVTVFFDDSERLLNELTRVLDQHVVDFKKVDSHVLQLKGSSASIGAQRVKNVCIAFEGYCEKGNREGCLRCLYQVKQEYSFVKNKLQALFRLEQQIVAAGGSPPLM